MDKVKELKIKKKTFFALCHETLSLESIKLLWKNHILLREKCNSNFKI